MECEKCQATLTSENTITSAEFVGKDGQVADKTAVDVSVECKECGSIYYTFVNEGDLILSE
jgi:RNase P subunit RPR2